MSRRCFVLGMAIIAAAASASIQDPVPIPLPSYTYSAATGVNNRGLIVGYVYTYPQGHAFLWSSKGVELFDFPGARSTAPLGINERGDIVGIYDDEHGDLGGFFRSRRGEFASVVVPQAVWTAPSGLNSREIVGTSMELSPDFDERRRGFAIDHRGVRIVDNPFGGFDTEVASINEAGVMVGSFGGPEGDDQTSGFILRGEAWTVVNYPGAERTSLRAIAADGAIVGYAAFLDLGPADRGFVYRDGRFADLPAGFTPGGVNASGLIVGDASGRAAVTCIPGTRRPSCLTPGPLSPRR